MTKWNSEFDLEGRYFLARITRIGWAQRLKVKGFYPFQPKAVLGRDD